MDKNLLFTSFNSYIYDLFFRDDNRLDNELCEDIRLMLCIN